MSELLAEAAESATDDEQFVVDGPEVEEQEPEIESGEGAELAPAESEETEKNTEEPDSQESVQKAINRQHRKYREEERRRLEIERELEETRKRLSELEQPQDVQVPPMPDAWDDDYEEKVKARDEALLQKARTDALRQAEEDRLYQQQQEEQLNYQREQQKKLESFRDRAVENGIKEADLVVAANRVADSGVSPEVADFLLTDPDGPLITAYLADEENTLELYELANMSPVMVGMKLTDIRQKAAQLKKSAPSAPPPPDTVSGKGVPEDLPPSLKGAKFE